MSWNDDIILKLQEDVLGRLSNDAYFADIPVFLQRKGDIEQEVIQALNVLNEKTGKVGSCVIVLMPELEAPEGESPGPVVEMVQSVQVITHRLFNDGENGTGKSSEQIAANVLNLLHRYIPFHLGWVMMADRRPVRPERAQDGVVSYLVVTRMTAALGRTAKVSAPQVMQAGAEVSLSTASAGAALYYTLDGTYPGPANEAATLYTVPFTPADLPAMLRVCGYLADHIPSDTVCADLEALAP